MNHVSSPIKCALSYCESHKIIVRACEIIFVKCVAVFNKLSFLPPLSCPKPTSQTKV